MFTSHYVIVGFGLLPAGGGKWVTVYSSNVARYKKRILSVILTFNGMLSTLVETIVNTNNTTFAKIITDTSTNTAFEKYCQYQYFCDITFNCFYIHQHSFFFWGDLLMKLIKWLLSRNWQNHYSLQWHDVNE